MEVSTEHLTANDTEATTNKQNSDATCMTTLYQSTRAENLHHIRHRHAYGPCSRWIRDMTCSSRRLESHLNGLVTCGLTESYFIPQLKCG
jgi:hypothetical protein